MNRMIALGEVTGETQNLFDVGFPPDENGLLIGFALDFGKGSQAVYEKRTIDGEHVFAYDAC